MSVSKQVSVRLNLFVFGALKKKKRTKKKEFCLDSNWGFLWVVWCVLGWLFFAGVSNVGDSVFVLFRRGLIQSELSVINLLAFEPAP